MYGFYNSQSAENQLIFQQNQFRKRQTWYPLY